MSQSYYTMTLELAWAHIELSSIYALFIVVLYVDDLIFNGNEKDLIGEFKEAMKSEFEMIDLGLLKYFLGIEVKQMHDDIFISQEKYAR